MTDTPLAPVDPNVPKDPSLVKKITVKTVCGQLAKPETNKLIMRIFGQATGVKPGQSNLGEYVALIGSFEAVKLETGEIYRSGRAILPPLVSDLITGKMTGDTTQFAFDVGIKPSASPVGYDYYCVSLIPSGDTDPLSTLKKQIEAKTAAPGPAPAPGPVKPAAAPKNK